MLIRTEKENGLPRVISPGVRTLLSVLLMIGLFPWVSFNLFPLGIQPWPLFTLLLVTLFFVYFFRVPSSVLVLAFIIFLVYIPVILLEFNFDFLTTRALGNYIAIFVSFTSYLLYRTYIGSPIRVLYTANVVWIISGLIQYISGNEVLSWLLMSYTSPTRGVTGLAPEPTYYAIMLFFLSWLIVIESKTWTRGIAGLITCNLLAVIFLAKSATVFLFYCVGVIVMVWNGSRSLRKTGLVFVSALAIAGGGAFVIKNTEESRIGYLLDQMIDNPINLLKNDASINARIQSAWFPWQIAVANYGIPGSAHGYQERKQVLMKEYPEGLFMQDRDSSDKIMSASGMLVFQQGILIMLLVIFSFKYVNKIKKSSGHLFVWYIVSIAAIPVAFPPLWFVWAALAFRSRECLLVGQHAS